MKLSQVNSSLSLHSILWFRLAQIGLIVIFLALSLTTSLSSSEGPDEVAHYTFNHFVAKYGRLPLNDDERLEAGYKADLPPLYYILAGLSGRGVDLDSPPWLKISRNNPRLQLVLGLETVKAWRVVFTEDPYRGEVLLWYVGRWVTVLCGLLGLMATYWLFRETMGHKWLALAAVALLAFLPTYNYISGVTSYEPLTGALMALYFLLLFKLIQQPTLIWFYLGLGISIGLAALTRQTVWPVLIAVPLLIGGFAYHRQLTWRSVLGRLGLFGVGLLVTLGLWLLYMAIYFNQIAQLGWFQGLVSPILIGDGSGRTTLQIASLMTGGELGLDHLSKQDDTLWQWAWRFFSGVWGPGWSAWLMLGLWVVALGGLIQQWRRQIEPVRLWGLILTAHLGLLLFFPFLRFIFSGEAATAMSQHFLFPAGAVMMILFIYGLQAWLKPRLLTAGLFILAGLYLWFSVAAIPQRTMDPIPVQTIPAADEQVIAQFGPISLIDYASTAHEQSLTTHLSWRADEFAAEDYAIELTLLDSSGQPRSRWVGQPLNGRYPTRAWTPGDRVRDIIYLPIVGLAADMYDLQLRVLDEAGSVVVNEAEVVNLGQVNLVPVSFQGTNQVTLNDQTLNYMLWQGDRPVTTPPLYKENQTVVISVVGPTANDSILVKLIGPDGQAHEPFDRVGSTYLFRIAPQLTSGQYRLQFEQWAGNELVAEAVTDALLRVETQARQFTLEQPVEHRLDANFANQITLLGYDLPQRRVLAGETLPVTLYWQALRIMGGDLIMFSDLIGEDQVSWGGGDRRIRSVYSTMLWAATEVVSDPFLMQIQPDTPQGIYTLLVGVYLPVGESPVSLPLVQEGQFTEITSVPIGSIKVGQTPAHLIRETATPQVRLDQSLGDATQLILLGYDLTDEAHHPVTGFQAPVTELHLTLYWRPEAPLAVDYTTFVHIRRQTGEIMAQKDQMPLGGAYPTGLWEPGEIIADTIVIPLARELAPGEYEIVAGLYNFQTGERLSVLNNPADEVRLIAVDVP